MSSLTALIIMFVVLTAASLFADEGSLYGLGALLTAIWIFDIIANPVNC